MIILFFIMTFLFIYFEQEVFSTSFYKLKTDKLSLKKGPIRIVQLSDLHSKSFGRQNRRLIRKIKQLNPDFIVTTGDMITSTDSNGNAFLDVVKACSSKYPIFYIEGNHEITAKFDTLNQETRWYEAYLQSLKDLGVHVLNNDSRKIMINDDEFYIYGLNVPLTHYYSVPVHIQEQENVKAIKEVAEVLPNLKEEHFNILLAHNPFLADLYESHGFDHVYCGHVHGGALRLPLIGGVLSPERKLFPKYSAGVYQVGKMKMIVSRGLGRLRLFNRPDIVVIEIYPQ